MISLLGTALITWLVMTILLHDNVVHRVLDQPNHRSLHDRPVPRTGGIALMAGTFGGWLMLQPVYLWLVLPLALALAAVSFLDDVRGLSITWRFGAHFVASLMLIIALPSLPGGAWVAALSVLCAVWMINLYNFMDGSDGLAGGMAVFGFGFYGLAAWMQGDVSFALLNGCIAVSALVFLFFNFNPARIFMGDAGSVPLGFLAAALGLMGWQQGIWPVWLPLLVFSPFVVDATATLLKRLMRGEKVWQAHREHYYQRLVQMGWGHRKTALAEYAAMLASGIAALMLFRQSVLVQFLGGGICMAVYLVLMLWIDKRWRGSDGSPGKAAVR